MSVCLMEVTEAIKYLGKRIDIWWRPDDPDSYNFNSLNNVELYAVEQITGSKKWQLTVLHALAPQSPIDLDKVTSIVENTYAQS